MEYHDRGRISHERREYLRPQRRRCDAFFVTGLAESPAIRNNDHSRTRVYTRVSLVAMGYQGRDHRPKDRPREASRRQDQGYGISSLFRHRQTLNFPADADEM